MGVRRLLSAMPSSTQILVADESAMTLLVQLISLPRTANVRLRRQGHFVGYVVVLRAYHHGRWARHDISSKARCAPSAPSTADRAKRRVVIGRKRSMSPPPSRRQRKRLPTRQQARTALERSRKIHIPCLARNILGIACSVVLSEAARVRSASWLRRRRPGWHPLIP